MPDPLHVVGWTPETGEVTVDILPEHPAYAALTGSLTRGLGLNLPPWTLLEWLCPATRLPEPPPTKINLSVNPQVAPVPASNLEPRMARSLRLSLTVTVPEEQAADALTELSTHMAELITERGATYASVDASVEDSPEGT